MDHHYSRVLTRVFLNMGLLPQFDAEDEDSEIRSFAVSPAQGAGSVWFCALDDLLTLLIMECSFHQDHTMNFSLPESYLLRLDEPDGSDAFSPELIVAKSDALHFGFGKGQRHVSVTVLLSPDIENTSYASMVPALSGLDLDELFCRQANLSVRASTEIIGLLRSLRGFRGQGSSARLWYYGALLQLLSVLASPDTDPPAGGRRISETDISHLAAVEYYIGQHYMEDISLDDLTRIACMGITKLKYSFKARYGCTVITYLQRKRMAEAKLLLESTDYTIREISSMVGYSSGSRFARLFREEFGLTPMEYRKKL